MQPPSHGPSLPASKKARIMSSVPESTHWRSSITISTSCEQRKTQADGFCKRGTADQFEQKNPESTVGLS